jgi:branched-chain amino acid transport system permease protein
MAPLGTRGADALIRLWPVLSLILILAIVVAFSHLGPLSFERMVIRALIMMTVVIGLYIFIGNSGVLSFGHSTFMVVSAYMSAWLTMSVMRKKIMLPDIWEGFGLIEMHVLPGALLAGLLSAVLAMIVGLPLMRLSGIAAAIGTFAVFTTVTVVYNQWDSYTKGASTLIGLPTYVDLWVAFGFVAGALLIAHVYDRSKFGLQLRATREDLVAAKAAGVNIVFQRMVAFVVSAFVTGIGGVLYVHFTATITQANLIYLNLTFITIVMLLVGGMRSLTGAVVGVIAISIVSEGLRQVEKPIGVAGLGELGLAAFMLVVLAIRPGGIAGKREIPLPAFFRRTE